MSLLSLYWAVTFWFSPYVELLLNILFSVVWFPKEEKKEKWKGWEKAYKPFNPLEVTLAGRGGVYNMGEGCAIVMAMHLFTCLRSEGALRDQGTGPQDLKDGVLFTHRGSCKLLLDTCTAAGHRTEQWTRQLSLC